MNRACENWKPVLLEAALSETVPPEMAQHLEQCPHCAEEWKAVQGRARQLQDLLPRITLGAEPSAGFRARVLAAAATAQPKRAALKWRVLVLAGATATLVALLMLNKRSEPNASADLSSKELAAAQKLTEWRAPSDTLLATPGQEMLKSLPKLGETYLRVPAKSSRED